MRQHFFHNYRDDLIYHLKHGPVTITTKTARAIGIDGPFGVTFQIGKVWAMRYYETRGKIKLLPLNRRNAEHN